MHSAAVARESQTLVTPATKAFDADIVANERLLLLIRKQDEVSFEYQRHELRECIRQIVLQQQESESPCSIVVAIRLRQSTNGVALRYIAQKLRDLSSSIVFCTDKTQVAELVEILHRFDSSFVAEKRSQYSRELHRHMITRTHFLRVLSSLKAFTRTDIPVVLERAPCLAKLPNLVCDSDDHIDTGAADSAQKRLHPRTQRALAHFFQVARTNSH
ncbi:MAG: hypothetical protein MHM6MM_006143 [Cercozoa sp. M6MM]